LKRFLIHTQYYPPEIGAPQARLSELAQGLSQKGFRVTVLTAMPNYPKGKIFSGYGGLVKVEYNHSIRIIRSFIVPTQKANLIPRLCNYFSFVFSSLIVGLFMVRKVDFILTESPPLFLGFSGYLLSRFKKAKWIFNVSDLWPESAVRLGIVKNGFFLWLSRKLEAFCYQKACFVTVQSKSILADISKRFPKVQTYHLSNGVDKGKFSKQYYSKSIRKKMGADDETIFLYGGLHGLAQGIEQIIFAAQKIDVKARFIFVGDGPEKENLTRLAKKLALRNVSFWNSVPKDEMPSLIASADVCVIPLKIYLPGAVPSKIYEAMASSKPILLIAEGEAVSIIKKNKAGIVVSPGDIERIIDSIEILATNKALCEELGSNGKKVVEELYDRQKIVNDFYCFLKRNYV